MPHTDDDKELLASMDAVSAEIAVLGCDVEIGRKLRALRRAVADRLAQLNAQAHALAEANAHSAELFAELDAFGDAIRAQNAQLTEHAARLEAAQHEATRLVTALADANAAAVLELMEADTARVDAERVRAAVLAERDHVAREAEQLRAQTAALASANVEMLLVVEARAQQVDELKARVEKEEAEKRAFREQALFDALTGLYNRRYYDEQLEIEFVRARRYGRELSVVFLDVDHFKTYNDRNGHAAGDDLLSRLARLVRSSVRVADIVTRGDGAAFAARYGGEEFIVLLPETPLSGATVVAERLRHAIEQADFAGAATQPGGRVTLSLGVASLTPADTSGAGLAARADGALYRAKRTGRNRTVVDVRPNEAGLDPGLA